MSNFGIYMAGFVIFVIAVAYALINFTSINSAWVYVGAIALIGIGIMMGVTNTRRREPPAAEMPENGTTRTTTTTRETR